MPESAQILAAVWRERPVGGTFNIALHAGLDGIDWMREVAREQSSQQCRGDAGLLFGVKCLGVHVHQVVADNGRDR
jgi:hypothetical protein